MRPCLAWREVVVVMVASWLVAWLVVVVAVVVVKLWIVAAVKMNPCVSLLCHTLAKN